MDKKIVGIFFKRRHTDKQIVDIWMSDREKPFLKNGF